MFATIAEQMKSSRSAERILYIADLKRDGLIKVGITTDLGRRLAELRRQFGPDVEIFESAFIPDGWGTPQQWELRFKAKILRPRYLNHLECLDAKDHGYFLQSGRRIEVVRCGDRAEIVDTNMGCDEVAFEKHTAWLDFEYAEDRSAEGEPSIEVIEATRAEATIAFRELFAAASCGSATRPNYDDLWAARRTVDRG